MLLATIRDVALHRRSAIVRANDGRGPAAAVGLLAGRVVWATARDQREDLAAFLSRRVGIGAELARAVRKELSAPASVEALAARLEAEGDVSRERLRALRLEHLRGTIAAIRPRGIVRPQVADWSIALDEGWTYGWDEVFFDDDGAIRVRPAG